MDLGSIKTTGHEKGCKMVGQRERGMQGKVALRDQRPDLGPFIGYIGIPRASNR